MDITYEHISIGITVTACIFAVVGGLIGLARGGKRAAIHIATAAAAFAAAVFLTVPFVTLTSGITRRLSAQLGRASADNAGNERARRVGRGRDNGKELVSKPKQRPWRAFVNRYQPDDLNLSKLTPKHA